MTKACVPVRPSAARNIVPWVRADLWTRPFDAHLAQISLPSLAGLADGVAIERTPFSRRLARWIGWSETAPPSVRSAVAEIGRYVFFWSGCDTVDGATLLHGGRSFAAAAVGVSVFFLTSRPLLGERFPFSAHDGYHHFYMADGQFTAIVAVCTAH